MFVTLHKLETFILLCMPLKSTQHFNTSFLYDLQCSESYYLNRLRNVDVFSAFAKITGFTTTTTIKSEVTVLEYFQGLMSSKFELSNSIASRTTRVFQIILKNAYPFPNIPSIKKNQTENSLGLTHYKKSTFWT